MSLHHIAHRLMLSTDAERYEKWKAFLKEKYDEGRKRVRNPNHDTQDQYPEVTVNTALHDDRFREHLKEEYDAWRNHVDSDTDPKSKHPSLHPNVKKSLWKDDVSVSGEVVNSIYQKYLTESEKDPYTDVKSMIHGARDEVRDIASMVEDLKDDETVSLHWEKQSRNWTLIGETLEGLSPKERFCIEGVRGLHESFQSKLDGMNERHLHRNIWQSWIGDSNSRFSLRVCRELQSIDVSGSFMEDEDQRLPSFERTSKETMEVIGKSYTFQQQVFKHLGITHVTLYRGVKDSQLDTEPPMHDDTVKVKTRTISSWSPTPKSAFSFGSRMIKCTVPVERIVASGMTVREMGANLSEYEFVVMGAEDLECEVYGAPYS